MEYVIPCLIHGGFWQFAYCNLENEEWPFAVDHSEFFVSSSSSSSIHMLDRPKGQRRENKMRGFQPTPESRWKLDQVRRRLSDRLIPSNPACFYAWQCPNIVACVGPSSCMRIFPRWFIWKIANCVCHPPYLEVWWDILRALYQFWSKRRWIGKLRKFVHLNFKRIVNGLLAQEEASSIDSKLLLTSFPIAMSLLLGSHSVWFFNRIPTIQRSN